MKRALHLAILALLWLGAWLLFAGKLTPAELFVGALCALAAAVASEIAWGTHLTAFGANFRALAQAWRLPWLIVHDTVVIMKVLLRHLFTRHEAQSLMLTVPFDVGATDNPDDAARRALAIGYTTMTPTTVVLGIDYRTRRMLFHLLERSPLPKMTRILGARP